MSYTYLLDTYAFIEKRLGDVHRQLVDAGDDDWKARHYAAGQIEALCELERFLSAHYDAKLPRRLSHRRTGLPECIHRPD
jgi:hypothetical protein